jgi:hypothetical protein
LYSLKGLNLKTHFILYTFVVGLILSYSISSDAKGLLPLELFANLPSVQSPKLSPDGEHILAVSSLSGNEATSIKQEGESFEVNQMSVGSKEFKF